MKKRFFAALLGCAVMNLLTVGGDEPQGGTPAPVAAEGEAAPEITEPTAEGTQEAAADEQITDEGNEGADVIDDAA